MKKHNFKLEAVLSIRENIEKQWEAKLGHANRECQIIEDRIKGFNNKIKLSKENQVGVMEFQLKCIYEDRLHQQISKANVELKEKEIARDKVKEVYIQKSIDRKIIDKLKEKSIKEYKKYSLKEETLFIDEINNSSKIRATMLEGVN